MEARDEPQYRTQVNPSAGWSGSGESASQDEAQYPIGAGAVIGAVIAGHCSPLPQEISTGPRALGSVRGGNDEHATPVEKSDRPVVATKPGNAGGAKGATS